MKSMTGFGKASFTSDNFEFEIELKSLNHRFQDIKIVLPREMYVYEILIKNLIGNKIKRGKIDCRVNFKDKRVPQISLDEKRLKAFYDAYKKADTILELSSNIDVHELLTIEGILNMDNSDIPENELMEALKGTVEKSIDEHQKMATYEGEKMQDFFVKALSHIDVSLSSIESEFPEHKNSIFLKLQNGVKETLNEKLTDEQFKRIMMEVALYVEKCDVNEEIVRLKSHVNKFRDTIFSDKNEIGKSLNFILQEMHREINTIGSKFNIPQVFSAILTIKEEIEKCRELIQNVE